MVISKRGKMIIKPGKIAYQILEWMQKHEGMPVLRKTTAHQMAMAIVEEEDVASGELTIEQTFSKMVKCNVLYKDKYPNSVYSDFRINYWHQSIPKEILANAPVEEKRSMAKTIDDMKPGQYMDEEGCVVTPGATVTEGDPFSEDTPVVEEDTHAEELADIADRMNNIAGVVDDIAENIPEKSTQEVSVPVEIKKDGKAMSITINLTINL